MLKLLTDAGTRGVAGAAPLPDYNELLLGTAINYYNMFTFPCLQQSDLL